MPREDRAAVCIGRLDQVLHFYSRFSLGFLKPFPELQFGTSDEAFGTMGTGGSFAYADPNTQVGFAYDMNRSDYYIFADPRETSLSKAVFECNKKS